MIPCSALAATERQSVRCYRMFRKLVSFLGFGAIAAVPAQAVDLPAPYTKYEINFIYNLLFCDEPSLWTPRAGEPPSPWQALLFSDAPDPKSVRALAEDPNEESRIRALAYNWLRRNKHPVPPRVLLGVI